MNDLITTLESAGHHEAAAKLRDGFRWLNGLTDGSALFLDAIDTVRASDSRRWAPEHREKLNTIQAAVHRAVYRG